MNKSLRFAVFGAALISFAACIASAQRTPEKLMSCRDWVGDNRVRSHCEIREQTLSPGGTIQVDGRQNGGISIRGWERNEVWVRSLIEAHAPTQSEADLLAKQVIIETAGTIRASGPQSHEDNWWSVHYEIFVPRRSDLSLQANNGGISIVDVSGRMDFKTMNGGISLKRIGGAVRGYTNNGGLHVELAGSRWDGEELNVRTTNGGVILLMPSNYSAHLETGTTNGNVSTDYPLNVPLTERGRMPKDINVYLGSGGPTVRVVTTNGGVRVGRASGE